MIVMAGGGRRTVVVAAWWAVASFGSCVETATGGAEQAPPTGWRDPEKRGGMIHDGDRRLASCDTVEITGGYEYAEGFYTLEGIRNGASYFVSSDRSAELFFSDRNDERLRNRRLPEDLFDMSGEGIGDEDEEDSKGARRRLGACNAGFWTIAPVGGAYPQLTVADCAGHPADIKVTSWKEKTCATCGEQTFGSTDPSIECYYGIVDEIISGDDAGDDDDDGDDGAIDTSSSSTSDGVEGDDDTDTAGLCKVLDVGGRYPGLYTVVGSYNDRGDYYSQNLAHNIFFELDSSSGSVVNGGDGDGDNDRRRLLNAVLAADPSKRDDGHRDLAACDLGYWIKTPLGGGYPFFAVADCADYPQNIATSSPWLVINCEGCDVNTATSSQGIACATGADAFVATPAPVPPVVYGSNTDIILPGAGSTDCVEVTVTGARAGAYTVVGDINDRADLRSDDGSYRFYWGSPAPSLEISEGTRRLSLEGEHEDPAPGGSSERQRGLADCDGYWYITPINDRYPAYAVWDCAYHPADIVSTTWLLLECESCEVETANPKPEASCTGATEAEQGKRGATSTTPCPIVFNADATPAPQSSAVSTCTRLDVTGDFAGNYTANGTYRGKADFFSDDGSYNLYFELAASRRALLADDGGFRGGLEGGSALLPGDVMAAGLTQAVRATRNLAICTSGYWILAPVSGDGYPVFGVPDCAEHPADIRGTNWLVASCETCGVQEAPSFVAPTIACSGEGKDDGSIARDGTGTPAPAVPENCGVVYVTGPVGGVYGQRGTHGGRGDFFSDNRRYNLYWAFYAGKPEAGFRSRRGLSVPEGVYGPGDGREGSEGYDLALHSLAADLRRDDTKTVGSSIVGADEGQDEDHADLERRKLEFCEDGFWLITPKGGGFPFYGTQNCANHPADMSEFSSWSVVECDECGSHPLNETFTFSCDGEGYTPPPSTAIAIDGTPSPADVVGEAGSSGAVGIKDSFGVGVGRVLGCAIGMVVAWRVMGI